MQGFNHALTGVALALVIKEPLLIAPVALASHFVLDIVPHYGEHSPFARGDKFYLPKIALDAGLSLGILIFAMAHWPNYAGEIALGVIFSMLPDIIWPWAASVKSKFGKAFYYWHKKIQISETGPGIIVEIIYAALVTTFLARLVV